MDVGDGVTFLSATLQELIASCLRRSHEDVEKEKRKLKDSNVAAEIKDTLTLHGSLELFANVIRYFMNEREQESDLERGFRMLAFQTIKDALGSETILLSDFYVALAANLGVSNRLQEAIEFAGRGLLIRIRVLGVLSAKTAESHFQLGNLYTRNDDFDEGYRELLAARHIYCKLLGERSAPATDCDILLGQLETKQFHYKKAYAFFARGFRHRYLSLGASDVLTTATAELLEATRAELTVKCFLPVELLDRASELDWHLEDPRAFEHFLHVYLTQLPPDDVLSEDDVASIVHKCYAVYVSSAKSPTTPTLLLTLRGEQTPTSTSSAASSSATRVWTPADLDEVVQSLLIRAFPRDHDAAHSRAAQSPSPVAMLATGGSSGSGSSGSGSGGAGGPNEHSPVPPLLKRTWSSKSDRSLQLPPSLAASSAALPAEENKQSLGDDGDALDGDGDGEAAVAVAGAAAAADGDGGALLTTETAATMSSLSLSVAPSTATMTTAAGGGGDRGDGVSSPLPPPSSSLSSPAKGFALKAKAQLSTTAAVAASAATAAAAARPKHWKPIPLNSPLRTATKRTAVIRNLRDDAVSFVRDDTGDLLAVAKCSLPALHTQLRSRTVAFAVLAWLSQQNLPERIAEGHRAAAAARQRRAQPAAAAGTGTVGGSGGGGDDKSGAKNALNALFGKRPGAAPGAAAGGGANGGGSGAGAATSGAAAVNDGRRDVARRPTGRVPMPPPLPKSWPPLPFEGGGGSSGGGGGGLGGLAAILGGRGGATGGGIGGNGGGGGGGEKRPKMKQIHLQGLASLDGTFWTATNEPVLRAEELFDDLEDEFLIGGVKPKKPAAFRGPGAGGGAGGLGAAAAAAAAAAAGAKSPMGKAAPVESALDPQRAQNINIMLAKFGKRSLDAIAESVVNFDVAAVGIATVTSLQQFVPTPDEFAKVRAFVEKKWKAAGGTAGAAGAAAGTAAGGRGGGALGGAAGGAGGLGAIAAAVAAAAARGGAKAAAASAAATATADDDSKSVASEPSLPPPTTDESPAPSPAPTPTPPPPSAIATKPLDALTSKDLNDLRIGRAEQYIFALSKIAGLEKRLAALSMVLSAQELHAYVVANTETLQTAVGEVRGSGRLRFILRSFLELNNALLRPVAVKTTTDDATAAAAASTAAAVTAAATTAAAAPVEGALQGFGLLQWSKLAQVKCNSGETATTYLVAKLLQRIPESLNLAQDLPTVDEARGVLLGRLAANVKKLDETVALLQELLAAEGNAAATVAAKNLTQALHETQRWAQDASTRHSQALGDFVALVAFFGETSPPVEAEQFFGEVSALCKAIAAAVATASSKTRRRALATGGAGGAH